MSEDGKALVWLGELALASFLCAAVISYGLLVCLRPLLARYTLAKPNARSSHKAPTPQGGGIAVIAATAIVIGTVFIIFPGEINAPLQLAVVFAAAILLALVGVTDDLRPLEAMPRLFLQAVAVTAVLASLPPELRVLPLAPWWIERLLLFAAAIWFVNLVNFMDGIDWMTVAEFIPATSTLALFGLMGTLPWTATFVALALCGAIAGFAPFNRPVARLFLGDVGSLPIGLILGWLLLLLAGGGHFAAALLLPLYYLADATITLLRRLAKGEQVTQAHRTHFYQRAMDNGFSVYQIVGRVFATNIVLAGLATITVANQSRTIHVFMVLAGSMLVGILLWNFERPFSARR
jgi:UDP-N-acetylmuramyl pentapeptide phosphotransferase/UDP-N-acetylglucosamine-1-phosphate transferase